MYKSFRDDRINIYKPASKYDLEAASVAETYKLMLNGSYGNLNNEYSWLYDPKVAMQITLNGQLFLSMLSEQFTDAGFIVDSLNTDGITCMFPENRKDEYLQICKEWENLTMLGLEFASYQKVIRRDVNSYIAIFDNGKVKTKGFFLQEPKLGKGYDKPVVKKALYNYFVNNVPVEDFIRNHDNIYDFCMMQKMDSKFKAYHNNTVLQKTNRFYAAKGLEAGYLYKVHGDTKSHVLKDSGVIIFNDYIEKDDMNINYNYYIKEANKIKNMIEPKQMTLW